MDPEGGIMKPGLRAQFKEVWYGARFCPKLGSPFAAESLAAKSSCRIPVCQEATGDDGPGQSLLKILRLKTGQ